MAGTHHTVVRQLPLTTSDGVRLEARWDEPMTAQLALVLCHPHPQQGGTMTAPLMRHLVDHLTAGGFAVLRFNFRGVGRSGGVWQGGEAETGDVDAAVEAAISTHGHLPLALAGWSFGAVVALRWQALRRDDESRGAIPYCGIAPPVRSEHTPSLPAPEELAPARRSFVLGDRDQFTKIEELTEYAEAIGASLDVLPGSDHFFYFREARLAEVVADALSPG